VKLAPAGLALGLAVAACSSPPAPRPIASHLTTPADFERERVTPAPHIAWHDSKLVVEGLPAIARGGELAVVALQGGDAGRGFPNLKLEMRDRGDQVVGVIDVLASNDFERLAPGGDAGPELTRRIAEANAELAHWHGVHDLVDARALDVRPGRDGDLPHFATGDALDVDWNVNHVHILRANTENELAMIGGASWLAKPHPMCAGCADVCENPAFLRGVFHIDGVALLVIQLGYRGTDTCWEPADQWHVAAW
jgi:hypothetical protein